MFLLNRLENCCMNVEGLASHQQADADVKLIAAPTATTSQSDSYGA